ncbi:VOC family protein [Ramlibacter sp. AW1]|uniref:VOC family protein n=1 Tax=Ramlibacter aurantiacus TaxID=2801330 RepID=A0A936ZKH7_9BURK|nr:VOC family protein [Ramlibacter aurantiacus]MBL0423009.1 VOC family protein [Ramlibacter aurantiacus]
MIKLHDIRYCRVGVSNLEDATRFATDILGLDIARRDGGAVYFKSDDRDHTLVYFEGDPRDHVVAFEAGSPEEIEQAAAQLERAGMPVRYGSDAERDARRVRAMIAFREPSGTQIELVFRPGHSGRRYHGRRDAGITGFSHVGLCTTDSRRDEQFWTRMCSAQVSDWIGEAPLLRIDEVHHKIALFPTTRSGIQHINHQVEGIDDLMRSWYFLRERGVRIVFGPGRHPTSGARFLYFEGPDGLVYEYSTGVRSITAADVEAGYRPRQFPFDPTGFCMWGSKPDIPEFRS